MSKKQGGPGKILGWFHEATSTVVRCHAIGAGFAILLTIGSVWVWSLGAQQETSIVCQGQTIDLGDAATLVQNASQWRELYALNYEAHEQIDARVRQISRWLPRQVEWKEVQDRLYDLGETVELQVTRVQKGDPVVGARVGVLTVSCQVSGSFASLCTFLDRLARDPRPIACSAIELDRGFRHVDDDDLPAGVRLSTDDQLRDTVMRQTATAASANLTQPCRASLTLRIPFAAEASVAGDLLSEVPDAS